jgi:alkylation response protein AidB-like acyl-CoA dehydrogenase
MALADSYANLEEWRTDLREWISENAVPDLARAVELDPACERGFFQGVWTGESAELGVAFEEWYRRALDARLVCPQWSPELGGRGLNVNELMVLREEMERSGMPRPTRGIGEWLTAPALFKHGTPEQQQEFLPKIRSGEHRYCQGFSEPGAGSDLAGVQTRGVIEGDEIVITGQKVWTSLGSLANMIFVLCKTEDIDRHAGLSFVIVPLENNNVTMRPIHQMSGKSTFNEEFFDGSRAPVGNIIGGRGNGWAVAMTTLVSERGDSTTTQHMAFEQEFWELVARLRESGGIADPAIRAKLAWAYTQVQLTRYGAWRVSGNLVAGREPGPWTSLNKLFTSEYHKEFANVQIDAAGLPGLVRPDGPDYPTTPEQLLFLWSRAVTIFAGSSQIQRNIIGERLLGLPK